MTNANTLPVSNNACESPATIKSNSLLKSGYIKNRLHRIASTERGDVRGSIIGSTHRRQRTKRHSVLMGQDGKGKSLLMCHTQHDNEEQQQQR